MKAQPIHILICAITSLSYWLSSADADEEIKPKDESIAGRNDRYTVTVGGDLIDNRSNHIIAGLPNPGDGSFRPPAVFSEDGSLLAYSTGGSSMGTAIVIVRLSSSQKQPTLVVILGDGGFGTSTGYRLGLRLTPPPVDLRKANHVYEKALSFSDGKLVYLLSADRKTYYFSYDPKTGTHVRLKDGP